MTPFALSAAATQAGLTLLPFADASDEMRAKLGDAMQGEGLVLAVPAGVAFEECVVLTGDDSIAVYVGAGAQVKVFGDKWLNGEMVVWLGDEAQCDATVLLKGSAEEATKFSQRGEVQSGAALTWRNIAVGGKDVQWDLVSRVAGADAVSNVDWIVQARGSERLRLLAENVFEAPRGGGEMWMKGVAEGKAHVDVRGMIKIGLGGGGTNTYLTQSVLMLDSSAKVDAIPGLEIKTNDVKASHSATVSRVSPEELFYFASRGIPQDEARRMYVEGFLGEVVARVPDAAVRQHVLEALEREEEQRA